MSSLFSCFHHPISIHDISTTPPAAATAATTASKGNRVMRKLWSLPKHSSTTVLKMELSVLDACDAIFIQSLLVSRTTIHNYHHPFPPSISSFVIDRIIMQTFSLNSCQLHHQRCQSCCHGSPYHRHRHLAFSSFLQAIFRASPLSTSSWPVVCWNDHNVRLDGLQTSIVSLRCIWAHFNDGFGMGARNGNLNFKVRLYWLLDLFCFSGPYALPSLWSRNGCSHLPTKTSWAVASARTWWQRSDIGFWDQKELWSVVFRAQNHALSQVSDLMPAK